MDALISSALEEVCVRGPTGVPLRSLWATLSPVTTSPSLKSSLWASLLAVQTLRFSLPGGGAPVGPADPRIRRVEDAEQLDLRVAADEHLRDCFLGLYDIPSSELPDNQRRALERIALARANGITQSQLAKEFGMEGNNFFYIVKKLESRGLIVRQQAVVKTREAGRGGVGEAKNSQAVTTNLMCLHRYAKHLSGQQRIEINKEARVMDGTLDEEETDAGMGGILDESARDSVLVKDYLPAMKSICDKLAEASSKVLVIADIKRDLGYSGRFGHRAWRTICHRLKDAGLVEEFEAKVNGKVERCLRLLKSISVKNFDSKIPGSGDNCNRKDAMKFGRRFQQTDQLVELAIDHQIYDMIDAEGTKGALLLEVCGKLGIDRKRNDSRLNSMFTRFGMRKQEENHKRTEAYRVWTPRNSNPEALNAFSGNADINLGENKESTWNMGNLILGVPHRLAEHVHSNSEVDFATHGKPKDKKNDNDVSTGFAERDEGNCMLLSRNNEPRPMDKTTNPASKAELDLVRKVVDITSTPLTNHSTLRRHAESAPSQTSTRMLLTTDAALREQRILDRLQDEKFILRAELHRWLASLEKDKHKTLDRKTIDRILVRLQQQGHCKCVHLSVPVVTNYSSSRTTMVVLHPSVQRLLPELSGEILDRLRTFEKNIRGFGSSRFKINESVPVLNDVMRTQNLASSDDKTAKSEATHASGFLLSKMVRAKLFHCFLWTHVSSLPGWDETISPGTYGCTFKSFSLEEAKNAIPLDLLLQIAGSNNKSDDILEKCKRGLRLSDLSAEEHKRLMDTQAIGKISQVFEMLRHLKLIRLVHEKHSDDGACATFSHALEIRPYLEEPPSFVEMLTSRSADRCPRIRHDFILSNREAVNEYWNTLEYCYAAADPKAALLSFPGSAVPEVFQRRSWASARGLSVDQRSKILKRIATDNPNEKISYADCEKIMKDLNVTLHQVLSVYNDIQRQVSSRNHGSVAAKEGHQYASRKYLSAPRKRKNSVELSPVKHARVKIANELSDEGQLTMVPEFIDQSMGDLDLSPRADQDHRSPKYGKDGLPENQHVDKQDDNVENVDDQEHCASEKCYPLNQSEKRKPADSSRFLWTDDADRNLVMQYARHRAALGARYQRVDWTKLLALPAPPKTCIRRMAALNRKKIFRKALLKFCSMLSHRYAKHLEKVHFSTVEKEGLERHFRDGPGKAEESTSQDNKWDDFDDENVKKALEDVLQYKRMAKLGVSKRRTRSTHRNMDTKNILEFESSMPTAYDDDNEDFDLGNHQDSTRRSRGHKIHPKFTRLFNEGNHVTKQVQTSLAVSNAVELLKLVFLSTSTASKLQNLMAGTLRRYSEHDLFAAFSYLREKKIMIGGNGGPFMLSQQFLQSIRKSPFPSNSGKSAAKFSGWLQENENNLMEEGIHLTSDLECGDIFQLFALVSSGELSIFPCVPEEGVGEVEDSRKVKRKSEDDDSCDVATSKKLRSLVDSELTSRREKGFPGIKVSLHRASVSAVDALNLFADWNPSTSKFSHRIEIAAESSSSISRSDEISQIPSFSGINPMAKLSSVSPWEAMAGYISCLMMNSDDEKRTSHPTADLFRAIYTEIQKAGDQGLSIEEISDTFNVPGEDLCEQIVNVLLAFRRVLKVNAFESIRVVDALYRSKYFLTSVNGLHQDVKANSVTGTNAHACSESEKHDLVSASSQRETVGSECDVHQVTILNCPEVIGPRTETHSGNPHEDLEQEKAVLQESDSTAQWHSPTQTCSPILPWVNGDGSVNTVVYSGLVRRVIGTVMQNPGILEDEIIERIDVLNPQSCRTLLKLMVLDNHIKVRKMHQSISTGPPSLLVNLFKNNFRETQTVYREHFFANTKSATFL